MAKQIRAKDFGGTLTGRKVTVKNVRMPGNRDADVIKEHTGKVLSTSIGVGCDFIEIQLPGWGRQTICADTITRVH